MTKYPSDFTHALIEAELTEFFDHCTTAHQNEYLNWIAAAKRPDTRSARIAKAIRMIADKQTEEKARTKRKQ